MFFFRKILVCLAFLCGASMAMDFSETGLRTMEDAIAFRDFSLDNTVTETYVNNMITKTVIYHRDIKRLDRAVYIIWKVDSLCGQRQYYLRTVAVNTINRLVNKLDKSETAYEIKLAQVLWQSQFDEPNKLINYVDYSVTQQIADLLSRKRESSAASIKHQILKKLKDDGYEEDYTSCFHR